MQVLINALECFLGIEGHVALGRNLCSRLSSYYKIRYHMNVQFIKPYINMYLLIHRMLYLNSDKSLNLTRSQPLLKGH